MDELRMMYLLIATGDPVAIKDATFKYTLNVGPFQIFDLIYNCVQNDPASARWKL